MHPTVISDNPGQCGMCGMDLVPVYEGGDGEASGPGILIDPATVQNIGVLTERVERGDLKVEIRTVGSLDYDEEKIFLVNTKFEGWIEKVHVNYVGESVAEGDPLFEIYSPDLVATQTEYLSALAYRDKMKNSGFPEATSRAENLLAAARSRLLHWDVSPEQISLLEERGEAMRALTVSSPASGVVVGKMDQALEGMRAKAGMNLYKIADLSTLWVHIDVYEHQLPWIKEGQVAEVEIGYYPGEVFHGKVLFFYPQLDKQTRTIRACVEIPNPGGRLRPEMYATVKFSPVAAKDTPLVPEMAVLHTGERDVIVLALGGGRFEPREVKLGLQGGGRHQVLEGLHGGEEIVTSSQFLIDSESNLKEAINKMLMAKGKGDTTSAMLSGSATKDIQHGSATKPLDNGSGTKHVEHGSASKEMDNGSHAKDMEHGSAGKHENDEAHTTDSVIIDPAQVGALHRVLRAYLPIWKILADDSTDGLKKHADNLSEAATEARGLVSEDSLKNQLGALSKAASEMKTGDLQSARESMKAISRAIVGLFESHDVRISDKHFIIECPMVDEKWIQDSEDVLNPFYGSSMLRCGAKVGEIG
jgi:Cu(I)/Ag(I) efflux system membrane fusion protein/cobalt-zinc-cadmium efflux system membrane fusion protein